MITSLSLNVDSGELAIAGCEHDLVLTKTQTAALAVLIEKSPHVVTQKDFEARVWRREMELTSIRRLIYSLRELLRKAKAPAEIEGLRNGRYRLVEPSDPQP